MYSSKKKIAWFDTHPIQYNTPAYEAINKDKKISQTVYYMSDFSIRKYFDEQFDTHLKWDIPLLNGYKSKFLKNYSFLNHGSFFSYINISIFYEIIKNKYDLVITHGWSSVSHFFVFISCKISGTPYSVRGDSNSYMINPKNILQSTIRKIIFRNANVIFFIGEQNKKFYLSHGVQEKKLIRMPLCINNSFFRKIGLTIDIDKEKKLLGIKDEKVLLISSKLIEKKSVDTLILALKDISEPYFLLVVGSGKLEKKLKKLSEQLNVKTKFLGFVNQTKIPTYYWLADIFIMTSKREPWGLSTNEAMNCNCAIILSDKVGGKDDLIKNNGFTFKVGNVNELRSKIEILLRDEEKLKSFKKNSKKIIENFDYKSNVLALQKYFNLKGKSIVK